MTTNFLTALRDIAAERARQVGDEGWNAEHDDLVNNRGELARAAACYALSGQQDDGLKPLLSVDGCPIALSHLWPWAWEWWKPRDARRDLVRAGALIVAEIERLDRLAAIERVARREP